MNFLVKCGVVVAMLPMHSLAAVPSQNQNELPERKTDYSFKQQETPVAIVPYSTVVYGRSVGAVSTMRGEKLYSTNKNLVELAVNPSGVALGIIEADKKGKKEAMFYSTAVVEKKLADFDRKNTVSRWP